MMIILFMLLLVTRFVSSQEIFLNSVTHIDLPVDTVYLVENYYYNDSWKLDSIVYNNQSGTKTIQIYRNDSLIYEKTPVAEFEFIYDFDSIVKKNLTSNEIDRVYFTDMQNRELSCDRYENGNLWISYNFTWENENSILFMNSLGDSMIFNYHTRILNPRYQDNTSIRFGIDGTNGSRNYISELIVPELYITELFIVDELEGFFPMVVTRLTLGSPTFKYVFDYHVSNSLTENEIDGVKIELVKYYNIMGQEIKKPKHGMYIERIQTCKGTVSKKYFIK